MLQDSHKREEYGESILKDTTSTLLTEKIQFWLSSTDNPIHLGTQRGLEILQEQVIYAKQEVLVFSQSSIHPITT